MNPRPYPVWIPIILALVGVLPACADELDSAEARQLDEPIDGQESALTVGDVRCTAQLDRAAATAGQKVIITADCNPTTSYYYQVRASITRPDGTRLEVKNFGYKYLRTGVATRYLTEWTVEAGARSGNYAVSLTITPYASAVQSKNALTSFNVTALQTSPPAPAPVPAPTPPPVPAPTPAPSPPVASQGISISGRHLLDRAGKIFTARGPELVTAELGKLSEIDAIAASGANALRMLLTLDTANQMTPQAFDQLVGRAVGHRMVVWLSLFTWDDSRGREIAPALGGGHLVKMSDYLTVWQRQWLKDLVKKYDGWVVVDAMQEFKSSIQPPEDPRAVREWVEAAKNHLRFFRQQGFTQPLEIMTSFEGRDLHAIIKNADEIMAADTLTKNGTKQTLFGWQAYWGPGFYQDWQGGLLVGRSLTAADAVKQFVVTRNYPIMVGLDSIDIPGTESYGTLMPACSSQAVGWLWWEWNELRNTSHGTTVRTSSSGFAGAVKASP